MLAPAFVQHTQTPFNNNKYKNKNKSETDTNNLVVVLSCVDLLRHKNNKNETKTWL